MSPFDVVTVEFVCEACQRAKRVERLRRRRVIVPWESGQRDRQLKELMLAVASADVVNREINGAAIMANRRVIGKEERLWAFALEIDYRGCFPAESERLLGAA